MKKSVIVLLDLIIVCGSLFTQPLQDCALKFDGTEQWVDCGNTPSLQITGNTITLEAWINAANWKEHICDGCIFNKEENRPDLGYMIRCGNEGMLNFNIGDSASESWHECNSLPGFLQTETWIHVAGVYDGTAQHAYINGEEVQILEGVFTIGNAPRNLFIGSSKNYPDRTFDGQITEARVWNVARTHAQIQSTMNDTLGPNYYLTPDSGLVAYYRFNEGSGQVLHDMTYNQNDGILGSTPDVDVNDPVWTFVDAVKSAPSMRPSTVMLGQNYPNPFNPKTMISYSIPKSDFVTLKIYDIRGREIQTLVNEIQQPNRYTIHFDAGNMTSGVYYYKLQVGNNISETKKMLLVR